MIVVQYLEKNDEVSYTNCKENCGKEFIFKKLNKKESIKIICPYCKSEITIKCMASGKITRKWKSAL